MLAVSRLMVVRLVVAASRAQARASCITVPGHSLRVQTSSCGVAVGR